MAFEKIPETHLHAADAGEDLSAKLHFLANVDTAGDIVLAGDGEAVLGAIVEAAESGKPATVQFGGIAKISAGAAVNPGALVASDANGQAITATTGEFVVGMSLDGANAADEIMSVAMLPGRVHA